MSLGWFNLSSLTDLNFDFCSILAEAKNLSFNATAAFKAYTNIKNYIDEADKVAKEAKKASIDALQLVRKHTHTHTQNQEWLLSASVTVGCSSFTFDCFFLLSTCWSFQLPFKQNTKSIIFHCEILQEFISQPMANIILCIYIQCLA